MDTIQVTLYKFDELAEEAQEKVLDRERGINVQDSWWYESELDYFADQLLAAAGFEVKAKDIHFSVYSGQGDGLSFSGSVNFLAFLRHFKACNAYRALYCALKNGNATLYGKVENTSRYYSMVYYQDTYINDDLPAKQYALLCEQAEQLERYIEDKAGDLAHDLYKMLEKLYEWETSEEAVKETIEINDYRFTQSGNWPRIH